MTTYPRLMDHLAAQLQELPGAQQSVVQAILDDPQAAVVATVEELAHKAGVSMPTIVRTCRVFGYPSVREFMMALAQDVALGGSYLHRSVTQDDEPSEVASKILSGATTSLALLQHQLDINALVRAADLIVGSERVDCYSAGATSSFISSDLQNRLFRLGLQSNSFSDAHLQLISASTLGPKGVAFAVSHVGRMPYLLEAARFARSQGAKVIALTEPRTPLAEEADVLLGVSVPQDAVMRVGTEAYVAHLMTIEIVTVLVAQRLGPRAATRLQQFKHVLEEHGIDSASHSAVSWSWSKAERDSEGV
jgi:RpiR family transcriptional regulator, carbohydrate utilization regulator